MGLDLCVPAMRYSDGALVCRPLPSTGLSPASPVLRADPTSPRRSPPLRLPLGSGSTGRPRGDERISRVPCASRLCVPTAEAPEDAGPLSPVRAAAGAFPAVAYGSASTVKGISGLVPFSPAAGGFRPTEFLSTLRPGSYPPAGARLGPSDSLARRVAGGTSCGPPGRRSPTGKRRLSPAHTTSPRTSATGAPLPLSRARTRPRGSLGKNAVLGQSPIAFAPFRTGQSAFRSHPAPRRWGARDQPGAVPGEAAIGEPADAICIPGRTLS